jgi:hypothetical protein
MRRVPVMTRLEPQHAEALRDLAAIRQRSLGREVAAAVISHLAAAADALGRDDEAGGDPASRRDPDARTGGARCCSGTVAPGSAVASPDATAGSWSGAAW